MNGKHAELEHYLKRLHNYIALTFDRGILSGCKANPFGWWQSLGNDENERGELNIARTYFR